MINWNDPIIRSITVGNIFFVLTLLVLWAYKPRMVTKENKRINGSKLVTIAITVALTSTLSTFLVLNSDVAEYKPEIRVPHTTMKFGGANY